MKAGALRDLVTIRRAEQVQNAKGGYDEAWVDLAEAWARVEGLDGRESMIAHALTGISAYRITIRHGPEVKANDQLVLPDGTELNIRSVSDPDGRRERLVILADTGSVQEEP